MTSPVTCTLDEGPDHPPLRPDYARLPEGAKERVDKQLALLLTNPRHPSLRLKKIRETEDIWEARISRGYRLTLQIVDDTFILRHVGAHAVLREP